MPITLTVAFARALLATNPRELPQLLLETAAVRLQGSPNVFERKRAAQLRSELERRFRDPGYVPSLPVDNLGHEALPYTLEQGTDYLAAWRRRGGTPQAGTLLARVPLGRAQPTLPALETAFRTLHAAALQALVAPPPFPPKGT